MACAACHRLSLSADRRRAPDEIRLLHTGINAKPIKKKKKGKGKQENVIETRGLEGRTRK